MKFNQAEIDAAAELIDFVRFNSYFGKEVMKYQPISENPDVTLNLVRNLDLDFIASLLSFKTEFKKHAEYKNVRLELQAVSL